MQRFFFFRIIGIGIAFAGSSFFCETSFEHRGANGLLSCSSVSQDSEATLSQESDSAIESGSLTGDKKLRDTESKEAATSDIGQGSNNIMSAKETEPNSSSLDRQFRPIQLLQLVLIVAVIFWGYSLVMTGRHGFGWKLLTALGSVITTLGLFFLSLFTEVTSKNEVGDWDDDSEG